MRRSTGPRKTADLSKSVGHRLSVYTLAAGATGVGMLAIAQPAAAKIVYTPADISLIGIIPIDLNHDGIEDFEMYAANWTDSCVAQWLSVRPEHGQNAIVGYVTKTFDYASALRRGAHIGKARNFSPKFNLMGLMSACSFNSKTGFRGPWTNGGKGVTNRYLGLKFFVKGKVHYGWARLNVNVTVRDSRGTLTGYAYETIPGKQIIAGQTKGTDDAGTEGPNASLTILRRDSARSACWRWERRDCRSGGARTLCPPQLKASDARRLVIDKSRGRVFSLEGNRKGGDRRGLFSTYGVLNASLFTTYGILVRSPP
jgi:hypothetical protein